MENETNRSEWPKWPSLSKPAAWLLWNLCDHGFGWPEIEDMDRPFISALLSELYSAPDEDTDLYWSDEHSRRKSSVNEVTDVLLSAYCDKQPARYECWKCSKWHSCELGELKELVSMGMHNPDGSLVGAGLSREKVA
jgi:hypothetical protein